MHHHKSSANSQQNLMNDNEEHKDFVTEFEPITAFLKICGVLPFYSKISEFKVKINDTSLSVYTFCVRMFLLVSTGGIIYGMTQSGMAILLPKKAGDTDNINQWIEIFLCITTYVTTIIISWYYSRKHVENINEILGTEKEILDYFGLRITDKCKHFKYFIFIIIGVHAYVIGIFVKAMFEQMTTANSDDWFNYARFYYSIIIYTYENFTCAIFMIYLTGILNVITKRFDFINNILKECVADDNYGKNRINDILFGFKIHTKLCNIMRDTNELSGVILLAFMGYSFYKITTDSYNSFVQITQQQPSLLVLQNCAVWLILNIFLLIIITECCGNVTSEANVTSQILSRSYGKEKNYKNIIDKFLTKSINQEIEFTAYGFFAIDSTTLFTILSAVTTYLVILIQFKQLEATGDPTDTPTTTATTDTPTANKT